MKNIPTFSREEPSKENIKKARKIAILARRYVIATLVRRLGFKTGFIAKEAKR